MSQRLKGYHCITPIYVFDTVMMKQEVKLDKYNKTV